MSNKIDTSLLRQNETVLMVLRRHWIVIVFEVFYLFLLIISSLLLISIHTTIESLIGGSLFWGLMALYWITFLLFVLVSWINDELDLFVITNERIIGIEQLSTLSRNVTECSLDRVQEVKSMVSGVFPTIFGYGEVRINTASDTSQMYVQYAPNPVENLRKINTIIQEFRDNHSKNVI